MRDGIPHLPPSGHPNCARHGSHRRQSLGRAAFALLAIRVPRPHQHRGVRIRDGRQVPLQVHL
eukprot:9468372-Pyramimonas_sp.AAC.1